MKYITTINGQTHEFEINAEGEVTFDGKRLETDFQSIGGQPVYSLLLDGKSYEAVVRQSDAGLEVLLGGRLFQVTVEDERQHRLRQSADAAAIPGGEFQLKAPMPGLVVAVPIEIGQQVKKGENLIILESMKMQNELKAPRDGKITRVRVEPGDSVDQNQMMVILE